MRKRVVSLGLALVMALGVSGVSGVREVRAEYKAVKVEKVGKEVKSKRGEMPKFLKESGVKGVKDDGEHVWLQKDYVGLSVRSNEKNTYYTITEFTDGSYGCVLDYEPYWFYAQSQGKKSKEGYLGVYPVDIKNWKAELQSKELGQYVYDIATIETQKCATVDGQIKQPKQSIILRKVGGSFEWVGTYKSEKDLADLTAKKGTVEGELLNDNFKYKVVQKVGKDGVYVTIEPQSVTSMYVNSKGLKAPIKAEIRNLRLYEGKTGDLVSRGNKGVSVIPVGKKAGVYRYGFDVVLKDAKGKTDTADISIATTEKVKFTVKKTVSNKDYAKGYKPKVKVEKKKAYLVFGNKIKRVVINGQEIESKKATTKMNVSRVVTKNGTYSYEVYTEDGLVGTGKITVKGLKK